jgi:hypothetical protein
MKKLFLIFLFFLNYYSGSATSFYFSNKGNDSNHGKSEVEPWCSLLKLSETQLLFKSGDSLLFERGSVFSGQISITTSGIYLGAYGVGPKPVISGSIEVLNWIVHAKNIWKAECLNGIEPANLFKDGIVQLPGRYPNTDYLTMSEVSQADTSIIDASMLFKDGYWNGAEIVVRSNRWTIDKLPVKEYKHKTFTTSLAASYPLQSGYGYFLQKHLSTLDQSGEWFYQASSKQIYLFLGSGVNPMIQNIRMSVLDFGLIITNAQQIVIENLVFEHQRLAGVIIKNSKNVSLQHIEIISSGRNGLEVNNCENPCVENSLISDSNNNGVEWHNNTGGTFSLNTVLRTGIHPGMGASGDGSYIALRITADKPQEGKNSFERNTIDSTGYIGIDFRTGSTSIRNNSISNFCLIKDDGGGIYTWENAHGNNTIEGNRISNGMGAGEGTINPTQLFASGIYIDDRSSHVLIKNNEVSNCATSGIFLHNAKVITIISNRLFKSGNNLSNKEKGQLYIKLDTLGQFEGNYDLQLAIMHNQMTAVDDATYCIYLSADRKQQLQNLGKISQNEFIAERVHQVVAELYHSTGSCSAPEEFALVDWQRESGYEKGSVFKKVFFDESFEMASKNLISNGNMTSSTKGWMVWPEQLSIVREKMEDMDGATLKVNFPVGSTEALLYHEGFSLRKGTLYRLSFSAMSVQNAKLEFVPLMANSPWQALSEYTCFSVGATSKVFIYYFRPNQDSREARVNFKSHTAFWIDNVSLYEIVETPTEVSIQY